MLNTSFRQKGPSEGLMDGTIKFLFINTPSLPVLPGVTSRSLSDLKAQQKLITLGMLSFIGVARVQEVWLEYEFLVLLILRWVMR